MISQVSGAGRATANIYPTTITFGGTFFSAELGVDVYTQQSLPANPNTAVGGSSEAWATSNLSLALMTAGAPRPGLVKITWIVNGWYPYDGSYGAHLTIGPWFSQDVPYGNYCCSPLLPVELGQTFSFQTSVSEHAYAVFFDGLSAASNNASIMLQFYESDGTTPVRIDDAATIASVPEPTCWLLLAVACMGILVKFRHRQI